MNPLIDMLTNNQPFAQLPSSQREIFLALADVFGDNDLALYLDPTELSTKLLRGSKHQWQAFLNLEPVRAYIRAQMAFQTQVATRKNFPALLKEAQLGDTTAAKMINDMSGIMNSGESNKTVVLYRANRPTTPTLPATAPATPTQEAITNHVNVQESDS